MNFEDIHRNDSGGISKTQPLQEISLASFSYSRNLKIEKKIMKYHNV